MPTPAGPTSKTWPAEEIQGEDSVQEPPVHGSGGGPAEVFQSECLPDSGVADPQFHAPVGLSVPYCELSGGRFGYDDPNVVGYTLLPSGLDLIARSWAESAIVR